MVQIDSVVKCAYAMISEKLGGIGDTIHRGKRFLMEVDASHPG
jgi:hypothetical protein